MCAATASVSPVPTECGTLVDVLRWRALAYPDAEAFTFLMDGETQELSLTYADLDRQARAVGAYLQRMSAPGERAILLLPAGLEYPIAFFGCLYAGVVPIPSQPPRLDKGAGVLESIVVVTGATVALTTAAVLADLQATLAQIPALEHLHLIAVDALPPGIEDEWHLTSAGANGLGHMLLTSGSTALSKAVFVTHTGLLSRFAQTSMYLGATPDSRLVSWMPQHAAYPLSSSVIQPVYAGVPVTFLSPQAFLERPFRWLQAISRTRATHGIGANFAYDLCVRTSTPEERATLHLETWEVAMSGGETIRPETLDRFTEAFAPCGFRREAFVPGYGMSEYPIAIAAKPKGTAPVVATFDGVALEQHMVVPAVRGEEGARSFTSVGRPSLPERMAIVDPEARVRREPDQVGELWLLGGTNHYFNNPDENTRTFNAYLADTGEGPFLRTGDLAFVHDGELYIVGRIKELIIIRGRNLSPQQIEITAEQSHPALHPGTAAAFSVDVDGEERLVIVQEIDGDAQKLPEVIAAIRHAVAKQHDIQTYAVVLVRPGALLRTTSGKIQRQPCRRAFLEDRLEVLERDTLQAGMRPALESSYVPPRTPVEQTLAETWGQVLHQDRVGIHDNFFELGGDSLMSMQVIARSRQAGLHYTIEQLVGHQTIAELALVVSQAPTMNAEQGLVTGPSPLLPSQARFFDLQDPDYYHIGFYRAMQARRRLDPDILAQALQHVVAHHDALRMRYIQEDGRWRQVGAETEDHHIFSQIDISWMSREQQQGAVMAAAEQLHYTLDLATGPLVRMTLFDLGPDEPSIVATVWHHLVFDAVSQRIILEDLELAYAQLSRGEAVRLLPKTHSLKAWAERLAEYAESPEARRELPYWLDESRRTAPLLPVDAESGRPGGGQVMLLGVEETKTLVYDAPRIYGTEINDILLTGLVRAFAEWTGSRSLLVDLVSHGRDAIFPEVDVSRTVGWLATFFPMLLDLGENDDPADELRTIKEQLRHIPTRGLGYGVLRYMSQDRAVVDALRSLPEPQVRFNYAGTFDQTYTDSTLFSGDPPFAARTQVDDQGPVAFGDEGEEPELLVSGQIAHGRLRIVMQSGRMVHDPATMARLIRDYMGALRKIIASCRAALPAR